MSACQPGVTVPVSACLQALEQAMNVAKATRETAPPETHGTLQQVRDVGGSAVSEGGVGGCGVDGREGGWEAAWAGDA